jgi:hypothetical protein
MATMISEVYDAFRSAGVPEDKARAGGGGLVRAAGAHDRGGDRKQQATNPDITTPQPATATDITFEDQPNPFDKPVKDLVLIKWGLVLVLILIFIPLLKPYWMQACTN